MCVSDLLLKLTCIKQNCKYGNARYSKSYLHSVTEVSCIINTLSWPRVCWTTYTWYVCRLYWISQYDYIAVGGGAAEASLKSAVSYPGDTTCLVNIPADLSHVSSETFSTSQWCAHTMLVLLICGHLLRSAPSSFSTLHQLVLVWSVRSDGLSALWWPVRGLIHNTFFPCYYGETSLIIHEYQYQFLEWTEWRQFVSSASTYRM